MVTLHLPDDTPVFPLVKALVGLGLMIDKHDIKTGEFTAVRIDRPSVPRQPSVCPTVARIRAARDGRIGA